MKQNNKPKRKKVEKLGFGYVSDEKIARSAMIRQEYHKKKEKETSKNNSEIDILKTLQDRLYDVEKTVDENMSSGEDRFLILKISSKENEITLIPDEASKVLTTPKSLAKNNVKYLDYLVFDYDTIFGVRYNIIKKYNSKVFDLAERVLFEALIIKFKRNNFEPFRWAKTKIGYELGLNRRVITRIIKRFKNAGIIKSVESKKGLNEERDGYDNTTFFDLDRERILILLPEIFSDFDYEIVEKDLIKYLGYIKKE